MFGNGNGSQVFGVGEGGATAGSFNVGNWNGNVNGNGSSCIGCTAGSFNVGNWNTGVGNIGTGGT